jgi:hypothetical protein
LRTGTPKPRRPRENSYYIYIYIIYIYIHLYLVYLTFVSKKEISPYLVIHDKCIQMQ